MPTYFGAVVAETDGQVVIRLDNGQELQVSAQAVTDIGAVALHPGARVRVSQTGAETKIVVIEGAADPQPGSEAPILARIIGIDRRSSILHLETERGQAQFGPVVLSENQWSRLGVGAEVKIVRNARGKHTLRLPEPCADESERPSCAQAPVVTNVGQGVVVQVGSYHTVVEDTNGQQYGLMRSRVPRPVLREGDRVTFRAIADTWEIVEIALLERRAPGFGGWQPCDGLFRELAERTGRQALTELAQHFCLEKRLMWHWITPKQEAKLALGPDRLNPEVIEAIQRAEPNFRRFFTHQVRALDALEAGKHVLVLTPTASGKTYCYNPAVFQALHGDAAAHALYVFPLNALLQDQVGKLKSMSEAFRQQGQDLSIDLLIGGLGQEHRDRLQHSPPQILSTNPEMLNWLLNSNAYGNWPSFFRHLRFIVLDEVHTYRSLLGLHMAGLIRRLLIVCRRHGNPNPRFVLSSATVGAPEELAVRLTSLPLSDFDIIDESEDGSEQQQRHWMVLTPVADEGTNLHSMHLHQAASALVDVLTIPRESLNVILFAKSIRDVRFIYRVVQRLLKERNREDLEPRVRQFASALLSNEEKRVIYNGLLSGKLRAVISTNALEAGIDIGKLDVCIIAGFPFHVMRMRQMAGRAGRRQEGAVLFIPHPMHAVDRFYGEHPERLLTQPPESFVIDHENPYIARKHIIASAASMAGGVRHDELGLFGQHLERMLQEAREAGVLDVLSGSTYTTRRRKSRSDMWAIGNLRSFEQNPYVICKAPAEHYGICSARGCGQLNSNPDAAAACPYFVQLLDRQYIYREAHPGAVFEDRDGNLYEAQDLDDQHNSVRVTPLPEDTLRRTFADEGVSIEIVRERESRDLPGGAILSWGDVLVTRRCSGFYEYHLLPRRRCPSCRSDYPVTVTSCPRCNRRTRPYLASSRPQYRDFPGRYQEITYSIELDTIACWLALPASLETHLEAVSKCKIPGEKNRVAQFLQTTPPFSDPADVASAVGVENDVAQSLFTYSEQHRGFLKRRPTEKLIPIYPAFYGQCLRYHLRHSLAEDRALAAFARATGYPVLTDLRHVCRNCVTSVLLPAAHTLNHLVALRYPTVALGDSQDLGFTTSVLHPQTRSTTAFWYDNYDGGVGAAEKIYASFDVLLHEALNSLECECQSDEGCPLCTQTLRCDRSNEALSKIAVRGLLHHLLGLASYIPADPIYWSKAEAESREQDSARSERAAASVHSPSEPPPVPADPFRLLRVQPHVHDVVLNKALNLRGEEIAAEVPPVSIQELQNAYQAVLECPRPQNWSFPAEWSSYEVLHVHPEASKRLAQSAYKLIVIQVHPDHNPQRLAWATEVTKRVNAAWETVKAHWAQTDPDAK